MTANLIGYSRVRTAEQNPELQHDALEQSPRASGGRAQPLFVGQGYGLGEFSLAFFAASCPFRTCRNSLA